MDTARDDPVDHVEASKPENNSTNPLPLTRSLLTDSDKHKRIETLSSKEIQEQLTAWEGPGGQAGIGSAEQRMEKEKGVDGAPNAGAGKVEGPSGIAGIGADAGKADEAAGDLKSAENKHLKEAKPQGLAGIGADSDIKALNSPPELRPVSSNFVPEAAKGEAQIGEDSKAVPKPEGAAGIGKDGIETQPATGEAKTGKSDDKLPGAGGFAGIGADEDQKKDAGRSAHQVLQTQTFEKPAGEAKPGQDGEKLPGAGGLAGIGTEADKHHKNVDSVVNSAEKGQAVVQQHQTDDHQAQKVQELAKPTGEAQSGPDGEKPPGPNGVAGIGAGSAQQKEIEATVKSVEPVGQQVQQVQQIEKAAGEAKDGEKLPLASGVAGIEADRNETKEPKPEQKSEASQRPLAEQDPGVPEKSIPENRAPGEIKPDQAQDKLSGLGGDAGIGTDKEQKAVPHPKHKPAEIPIVTVEQQRPPGAQGTGLPKQQEAEQTVGDTKPGQFEDKPAMPKVLAGVGAGENQKNEQNDKVPEALSSLNVEQKDTGHAVPEANPERSQDKLPGPNGLAGIGADNEHPDSKPDQEGKPEQSQDRPPVAQGISGIESSDERQPGEPQPGNQVPVASPTPKALVDPAQPNQPGNDSPIESKSDKGPGNFLNPDVIPPNPDHLKPKPAGGEAGIVKEQKELKLPIDKEEAQQKPNEVAQKSASPQAEVVEQQNRPSNTEGGVDGVIKPDEGWESSEEEEFQPSSAEHTEHVHRDRPNIDTLSEKAVNSGSKVPPPGDLAQPLIQIASASGKHAPVVQNFGDVVRPIVGWDPTSEEELDEIQASLAAKQAKEKADSPKIATGSVEPVNVAQANNQPASNNLDVPAQRPASLHSITDEALGRAPAEIVVEQKAPDASEPRKLVGDPPIPVDRDPKEKPAAEAPQNPELKARAGWDSKEVEDPEWQSAEDEQHPVIRPTLEEQAPSQVDSKTSEEVLEAKLPVSESQKESNTQHEPAAVIIQPKAVNQGLVSDQLVVVDDQAEHDVLQPATGWDSNAELEDQVVRSGDGKPAAEHQPGSGFDQPKEQVLATGAVQALGEVEKAHPENQNADVSSDKVLGPEQRPAVVIPVVSESAQQEQARASEVERQAEAGQKRPEAQGASQSDTVILTPNANQQVDLKPVDSEGPGPASGNLTSKSNTFEQKQNQPLNLPPVESGGPGPAQEVKPVVQTQESQDAELRPPTSDLALPQERHQAHPQPLREKMSVSIKSNEEKGPASESDDRTSWESGEGHSSSASSEEISDDAVGPVFPVKPIKPVASEGITEKQETHGEVAHQTGSQEKKPQELEIKQENQALAHRPAKAGLQKQASSASEDSVEEAIPSKPKTQVEQLLEKTQKAVDSLRVQVEAQKLESQAPIRSPGKKGKGSWEFEFG
ncbi:unnamed protein product, partial [Mesorhabditis spiculigera]